jgi:hypothetical protein
VAGNLFVMIGGTPDTVLTVKPSLSIILVPEKSEVGLVEAAF